MEISQERYQVFLDNQQVFVGVGIKEYDGLQARDIAEIHLDRLNQALEALREIAGLKIFGSALTDKIPSDIDVFYDIKWLKPMKLGC